MFRSGGQSDAKEVTSARIFALQEIVLFSSTNLYVNHIEVIARRVISARDIVWFGPVIDTTSSSNNI
ncbi:hypothetical protein TNCV_3330121 [Trichonephila clavipes]|nr:hypothetical protein TNCV_3330121 [Trichonephila clavipes]